MILITGATGYIGSHTVAALLESGHVTVNELILLDNFSHSSSETLMRLEQLFHPFPHFYPLDLLDKTSLISIFQHYRHQIQHVIHFAALKSVAESVAQPLRYYSHNLSSTMNLVEALLETQEQFHFIFSSSATVYGEGKGQGSITESQPLNPLNPYGQTKAMMETILTDTARSLPTRMRVTLLRYFNPVGAHPSGLLGESLSQASQNLMPLLCQVLLGERNHVSVYGMDYETRDGTGERDYVHVMDLAEGHVRAVFAENTNPVSLYNLGTGKTVTVLELIRTMQQVTGLPLPWRQEPRRLGDVACLCASIDKVQKEWHWKAEKTVEQMCRDVWHFIQLEKQRNLGELRKSENHYKYESKPVIQSIQSIQSVPRERLEIEVENETEYEISDRILDKFIPS